MSDFLEHASRHDATRRHVVLTAGTLAAGTLVGASASVMAAPAPAPEPKIKISSHSRT